MSKSLKESAVAMLEAYMKVPPERTREGLREYYADISLRDAERVKEGLIIPNGD